MSRRLPVLATALACAACLAPTGARAASAPVLGPPAALVNPQSFVIDLSAQWTASPAGSFVVSWYGQGGANADGYLFGARGPFAAGATPATLIGPAPQKTAFGGAPFPAVGFRSTGSVVAAGPIGDQPGARLGTTAGAITQRLPAARALAPSGTATGAVLGVRSDGGAVIAASSCSTSSCGRRTISLITRSNTGQTGAPVTITGGGVARPVAIAVNARGDAFVTWVRDNRVEGRLRTAGGSVGPVANLGAAQNSFAPLTVTITSQRRVVVAWENQTVHEGSVVSSDGVFWVAVSTDGRSFSSAHRLETQTDRVRTPGAAIVATLASDNTTWVGWTGRASGRFVVRAARVISIGPQNASTLSTSTTADSAISDIAGGEGHSVAAVWVQTAPGNTVQDSNVLASIVPSEYAPWGAPETIAATTNVFSDEQEPVVSIQPGTRTALFAWTQRAASAVSGDEQVAVRTRTIP